MTAEELEAGKEFGRYLDVDGDGIPYRTYPGTHPTKGSFFTRGTSRDRYAKYTEEGAPYVDNMQRLVRKFDTAKDLVPRPLQAGAAKPTKYGVIYYGSTSPAMDEAIAMIEARGHALDRMRVRAFPFHSSVNSFVATMTSYSWSSRTATRNCVRSSSTNAASIRCGWCRSCITTAHRSPSASSPRRSAIMSTN